MGRYWSKGTNFQCISGYQTIQNSFYYFHLGQCSLLSYPLVVFQGPIGNTSCQESPKLLHTESWPLPLSGFSHWVLCILESKGIPSLLWRHCLHIYGVIAPGLPWTGLGYVCYLRVIIKCVNVHFLKFHGWNNKYVITLN